MKAMHLMGRAVREFGQALDRVGLTLIENEIFRDTFTRHRNVMNLFDKRPNLFAGVFVAPNASVVGNVQLLSFSSIWYGAVLRGDKANITIGFKSNVQDRTVITTVKSLSTGFSPDVEIGEYVTIGHGALMTSCTVENRSLIGQGAVVPEGCEIGMNCIIAAGAVLMPFTIVPDNQLWAGNPAKYIRDVTEDEVSNFQKSAEEYHELACKHSEEFLPFGTAYQEAEKINSH